MGHGVPLTLDLAVRLEMSPADRNSVSSSASRIFPTNLNEVRQRPLELPTGAAYSNVPQPVGDYDVNTHARSNDGRPSNESGRFRPLALNCPSLCHCGTPPGGKLRNPMLLPPYIRVVVFPLWQDVVIRKFRLLVPDHTRAGLLSPFVRSFAFRRCALPVRKVEVATCSSSRRAAVPRDQFLPWITPRFLPIFGSTLLPLPPNGLATTLCGMDRPTPQGAASSSASTSEFNFYPGQWDGHVARIVQVTDTPCRGNRD